MADKYFIVDLQRTNLIGIFTFWKSNKRGYTIAINEAGIYSEEESLAMINDDVNGDTVRIPVPNNLKLDVKIEESLNNL